MRNIQNKLVLYWSKDNKIYDLISELPIFCYNFEKQVKEGFLPNIGNYYLSSYVYDINDFLSNNNNICYKIKTPYKKDNESILKDLYLLLTASSLLILESIDEKAKNKCVLSYVGELFKVEKLVDLVRDDQNLEEYDCFKIDWKNNIKSVYNKVICVSKEEKEKKDIYDLILARRDIIINNFKLIENENLEVEDYKLIIGIKKKLIEKEPNEIIYDEINKCYSKIVEILSNYEDEDFQKYLNELHKFIEDYENKFLKNKK
jgi:hypothetical protein